MSEITVHHSGEYAWMIERRADIGNESSTQLWWDGRYFSHGLMHATATDHEWVEQRR